ncbi:MAG TPA: hypothetical protein VHA06_16975 [Candidatus Angelobacter sp.]|jgi:hypothetical protein|nr:hypothetical protein [Candidatus Angelobacter sp.]
MTENQHDEKVERYLRQFRPQHPRPLPGRTKAVLIRWRAPLAAGAAAAIVLSIAMWLHTPRQEHSASPAVANLQQAMPIAQEISLSQLSRAAQKDPASLDAQLDSLSTRLLPDVRRSHGILNSLARE